VGSVAKQGLDPGKFESVEEHFVSLVNSIFSEINIFDS
jgi:hypothetical protein